MAGSVLHNSVFFLQWGFRGCSLGFNVAPLRSDAVWASGDAVMAIGSKKETDPGPPVENGAALFQKQACDGSGAREW